MKNLIIFCLSFVFIVLTGCAKHSRTTQPPLVSKPVINEPVFVGWDNEGRKTTDINQIYKSKASAVGLNNKVILNEDSIICETQEPLLTTGLSFISNRPEAIQGSILMDYVTGQIQGQKDNRYLSMLHEIESSSLAYKNSYKASADKAEDEIKTLTEFTNSCQVNEKAQTVQLIENKPISKISKIKVQIENNFYDLWVYNFHLTNIN